MIANKVLSFYFLKKFKQFFFCSKIAAHISYNSLRQVLNTIGLDMPSIYYFNEFHFRIITGVPIINCCAAIALISIRHVCNCWSLLTII